MARRFSSFKRSHSHSFGSAAPGRRFRGSNSGGFRNFRKQPQPLDINLFIKKAKEQEDETAYVAQNTFESFNLSQQLLKNIKHKGYTSPTPIQDQSIRPIMEGKDLIGIANTGTGKTAAFLLPMIEKIAKDRTQKVFIVAPTRELAVQINEELRSFTFGMNIYSSLLIGGSSYNRQIFELRRNPQFVIGTPGRIKDMMERRALDLSQFQNVILDEVDLMVDIGFIKTVEYFISQLSKNRQSLFFSATVDNKVSKILQAFVKEAVTVSVKKQETAEYVDQDVVYIKDRSQKIEQLHDLLNK